VRACEILHASLLRIVKHLPEGGNGKSVAAAINFYFFNLMAKEALTTDMLLQGIWSMPYV